MASDTRSMIIQEETRYMSYYFQLAAMDRLYPSYTQPGYHISKSNSMGDRSGDPSHHEWSL